MTLTDTHIYMYIKGRKSFRTGYLFVQFDFMVSILILKNRSQELIRKSNACV